MVQSLKVSSSLGDLNSVGPESLIVLVVSDVLKVLSLGCLVVLSILKVLGLSSSKISNIMRT